MKASCAYSGRVYEIPPERVFGRAQANTFGYATDGKPILTQQSRLVLNNLEDGKIKNFWMLYKRRPHLAFGIRPPAISRCSNTSRRARACGFPLQSNNSWSPAP